MECCYCNKIGHLQKYCFKRRKENKEENGKQKENDHDDYDRVTTTTIGGDLVLLHEFEYVNLACNEIIWIIDSDVTPSKEFFTSCTSGDFGMLKMGNDGVSKVGDVRLQTNKGV